MAFGVNFPVGEYYKDHILDAETLTRRGGWWTALLLIEDPKNGNKFVRLYRWQKRGGEWKTKSTFNFSQNTDFPRFASALEKFLKASNE